MCQTSEITTDLQCRINHLVGPTHCTTPGPHWNAQRRRGR